MSRNPPRKQQPPNNRLLPYESPPEEEFELVGTKQTGILRVPKYGSLTIGEAKALAQFSKDQAKKRGVTVDQANKQLEAGLETDGEEAIELAVDLAHILAKSRLHKGVSREEIEGLPTATIMRLANIIMQEAAAGNAGSDGEGKATAKKQSGKESTPS